MSAKEQLLNILDYIGENEATQILIYTKETFSLKQKTWEDIEEDEPIDEEITAFKEWKNN